MLLGIHWHDKIWLYESYNIITSFYFCISFVHDLLPFSFHLHIYRLSINRIVCTFSYFQRCYHFVWDLCVSIFVWVNYVINENNQYYAVHDKEYCAFLNWNAFDIEFVQINTKIYMRTTSKNEELDKRLEIKKKMISCSKLFESITYTDLGTWCRLQCTNCAQKYNIKSRDCVLLMLLCCCCLASMNISAIRS